LFIEIPQDQQLRKWRLARDMEPSSKASTAMLLFLWLLGEGRFAKRAGLVMAWPPASIGSLVFVALLLAQSRQGLGPGSAAAFGVALMLLVLLAMGLVVPTCLARVGFAVACGFIGRPFERGFALRAIRHRLDANVLLRIGTLQAG
jgi:hypothetical protein